MRCLTRALLILLIAVVSSVGLSQDKPAGVVEFNEFNAKPVDGWDWDDDERLEDLVLQLQQKELTLQALDSRIAKATGRKAGAKMDENMAWRSNLRMDLNAGGPVRWDAFYGRNAENFFYHPVDPNTTYHTTTALQQVTPTSAGGVPGNQGVPAHQRPPQFDYIYRGYEKKQAKAQELARELASKVEEMTSRRRQLEAEVVLLWFKLAFRVIDRDKIPEKPVLRFAVMPKNGNGKDDMERAVALSEATQLLAIALLFNEPRVESEPDKVFRTVGTVIQKQRKKFEDSLIRLGSVVDDSEDKTMPIGQYKFLARKLEDTSKSLSEGYGGWKDGDQADDEPTKFTGLRRVQDSVVRYSKICLALNELVDLMKKEWGMRINTDSTEFVPQWDVAYVARERPVVSATKQEEAEQYSARPKQEEIANRSRAQKPEALRDRLRGKAWQNTNNAVFAWDSQGTFTHNGRLRDWSVVGNNSVAITFGPGHVDTLVFSEDMQTFQQFSTSAPQPDGRPLFTGRRR